MLKVASSLRPHIVQVMAANQERVLSTEEIYELVACKGRRENVPRGRLDRRIRAVENCTAWRLSWG